MLTQPRRHRRGDERVGAVHQHAHQEQQDAVPVVARIVHWQTVERKSAVLQDGEVDGDGADGAHHGVVEEEQGNGDEEHDGAGGGAHPGAVGDEAGGDAAEDAAVVEEGGEGGGVRGVHVTLLPDVLGQPVQECVAAE